jgi:hypothetical protein
MPPQSYLSLENNSKSVYTKSESSNCEVGEDYYKKDPNFTFIGFINFSFKLLVT